MERTHCQNCFLRFPLVVPARCPSCGAPTYVAEMLVAKAEPWTEREARIALAEAKERLAADP
jgi:rRNA maturation endonuclease Nob1